MLRARLRTTPRVVMKVSTDEKDSQLLSAVGICPSYPLQGKGTISSSSKMAGKGQRDLRGSQAHKAKVAPSSPVTSPLGTRLASSYQKSQPAAGRGKQQATTAENSGSRGRG